MYQSRWLGTPKNLCVSTLISTRVLFTEHHPSIAAPSKHLSLPLTGFRAKFLYFALLLYFLDSESAENSSVFLSILSDSFLFVFCSISEEICHKSWEQWPSLQLKWKTSLKSRDLIKKVLICGSAYAGHPLSERLWRCSRGKETRKHGKWCLEHSE